MLKEIKNSDELRTIPVIILTTSTDPADVRKAYQNYTNSYIAKPIEIKDFLDTILKIQDFWLQITILAED